MKKITITLSKNDLEFRNGKWFHKELSRKEEIITPVKPIIGKKIPWLETCLALKVLGFSYNEIAKILNAKGFVSAQGKELTIDHLRNRVYYSKKGETK